MNSQSADFRNAGIPSYCRPLPFERAKENEVSRRLYQVLLRWIRYADQQFAPWPERPDCGHFFGGSYWYELETAYTAMIFAAAGKLGEYDATLTGQPREVMVERAIQSLRYLCFTHDTGPEACVRTEGRNPYCSGLKWGGRGDGFFRASQTGTSINAIGYTAWLVWEDMDDETRLLIENVLVYYADRWTFDEDPRNGVYFNTQCEENAWTAAGIGAAAALFPRHPRNAQWKEAAERWAINSVSTAKDQIVRGPLVSTATFHPDFTAENHAFVHPSYMFAGITLRGYYAMFLLMAGEAIPEALTLNNVPMYERTIKRWSLLDGYPVPIQGQDWWYNRQHEALIGHAYMNIVHQDADAALLEARALAYVEDIQASNSRGCMLEENGEECIVVASSFQTAVDMEFASAHSVALAYFLHLFGGPGEAATEPAVFEQRMGGVELYPYGSVVTHRTEAAFSSFSWRSHVMALTMPRQAMWSVTPLYTSYTGEVEFAGEMPDRAFNESVVLDTVQERVQRYPDGFGVTAELKRGANGQLLQRIGFISLPNGQSVYAEQIEVALPCRVKRLATGVIGIRNERYDKLPGHALGRKTFISAKGAKAYAGFYGKEPNLLERYEAEPWVNVNDEIGYITFGSEGMSYLNQHEYPKWKGVEDVLTLNEREDRHFETPAELPAFVVLTLPNCTAEETAASARKARLLHANVGRLVVLETNDYLIRIHNGTETASYEALSPHSPEERVDSTWPMFEGKMRLSPEGMIRYGQVTPGEAGYLPCRFELTLADPSLTNGSGFTGAVEAIVSQDTVILRNDSELELPLTVRDRFANRVLELRLNAGSAYVWGFSE